MKLTFALLAALCAATAFSCRADAQPETLTASAILDKSRAVYAGLRVYQGNCSVVSDSEIEVEGLGRSHNISSASAHIDYERGKFLSLQGVDAGGQPFRAFSSPKETWLEIVRGREAETKPDFSPRTPTRESLKAHGGLSAQETLLASLTGVTSGTASLVPAALAGQMWSNPFPYHSDKTELREAKLGETPCYIVVATDEKLKRVDTFWIEQQTFLLRRLQQEQGAVTYDDMPEINEQKLPTMCIGYSSSTYVFATTETS